MKRALLIICLLAQSAPGQDWMRWATPRTVDILKSSPRVLNAFRPAAAQTRDSVVIVACDGELAALGTVVEAGGLVITKASELRKGRLTCVLESGEEGEGKVVATDDRNDVALLQIKAKGLRPIEWAAGETTVGQWVVTPGLRETAEAVGIVSARVRRIMPQRALIGVELGPNDSPVRIAGITPRSGAEKAGLKAGDLILAFNGKPVKERTELTGAVRELRAGALVELRVKRGDREFSTNVQLTAEASLLRGPPWRSGFNREAAMNRMGSEVSKRAEDFASAIQHDTVLEPWQCGGPLVDLDGKAVGINIARAGRVASYALPADLAKQIVADLKKAGQD